MGRQPIPKPSFLDTCEPLGYIYGDRRWRNKTRSLIYTWDALHGEIEMFSARGEHRGVVDKFTGERIKPPVKGRRIRV